MTLALLSSGSCGPTRVGLLGLFTPEFEGSINTHLITCCYIPEESNLC